MTTEYGIKKLIKTKEMFPLYFIRHNFSNNDILEYLYEKNLICIHFNKESYYKWVDYSKKSRSSEGFRRAWKYFEEITNKGAFIFAEYKSKIKLGFVKPDTQMRLYSINQANKGYKTLKLFHFGIRNITQHCQ